MDDIRPQPPAEGAGQEEVGHGIQFDSDLLGLENREAGSLGNPGWIAGDGEGLPLIGPEDHDKVVALGEVPVDRHMHHDIGHAAAEIVALPDGVPQVVVHVLVGRQLHELDAKADLLADGLGEIHIGALKGAADAVRERREVAVDGEPQ